VKTRRNVAKAKATKQNVVVPKTPKMSLSSLIISENEEGDNQCAQHKRSKKAPLIKPTLKRKVKEEKITTVISHITAAGEREQYPRLAKLRNWQDMAVVMGGYSLSVKKSAPK
jgi:hypothetical protein